QSSVQELTGERSVLFSYRSLPRRRYLSITVCRQVSTGWDPTIDSRGHEWRHG
ncbi:unnamed protein product, partial [Staurois parvus]